MSKPFHIPSLDGIRAISILIVFVSHVGYGHVVPGGFGVTIFFFLSGYLITALLIREHDRYGRISMPAFYGRRVLRLAPPILVTLLLAYGLLFAGLAEGSFSLGTLFSQIFFYYNYYALWAAEAPTVDGLGILWSLAVEEHFYLIWPMLFVGLAARVRAVPMVVALLGAVLLWRCLRWYLTGAGDWVIYSSTDTRLDSILYGCLLAFLHWKGQAARLFDRGVFARTAILAAALAILLACVVIRDEGFRATLRYSLQGIGLIPLFHYAVTRPNDWMFRPLNWGVMRRIGQWSFTIYLVHYVCIDALAYNGVAAKGSGVMIVLSLGLSMAYAAAVFAWLEKPLHPLRRKLTGH